jgi:hypothetical protein
LSERTIDRASAKICVKKTRQYKGNEVIGSTWEIPSHE